jgi:hypothetical protein
VDVLPVLHGIEGILGRALRFITTSILKIADHLNKVQDDPRSNVQGRKTDNELVLRITVANLPSSIATKFLIAHGHSHHAHQEGINPQEGHLQNAIEEVDHRETNIDQENRVNLRANQDDRDQLFQVPTVSR